MKSVGNVGKLRKRMGDGGERVSTQAGAPPPPGVAVDAAQGLLAQPSSHRGACGERAARMGPAPRRKPRRSFLDGHFNVFVTFRNRVRVVIVFQK